MQSPEVDKQLESLEEVFFSWKFERPWLLLERLFEMELSFDPLWNCTIGTCSDFFDLLNITGQESRVNESNNWLKQGIQQRFENHHCKHHMFSYASQGVLLQIHGSLCMLLLWRVLAYHGPYDFDPLLWLGCFSYRLRRWRDCFVCLTCHCNLAQQNLKNKNKKNRKPDRWCLR